MSRATACSTDSSLRLTSCALSRPCGVPLLAHSASRSDVGVVYGQSVAYTCVPGFEETEVDGEKVCGKY